MAQIPNQIFHVLQTVTLDELDAVITWLEESCSAYKALRAVKAVMQQRPPQLEVPTPWVSALDQDRAGDDPAFARSLAREAVATPRRPHKNRAVRKFMPGELRLAIEQHLLEHGPQLPELICQAMQLTNSQLSMHIRHSPHDRYVFDSEQRLMLAGASAG